MHEKIEISHSEETIFIKKISISFEHDVVGMQAVNSTSAIYVRETCLVRMRHIMF